MKHPRIVTLACCFLSAAALGLSTPSEAQNPPPNPEPPGDPVIAAVNPKPPLAEINEEGPREPRKKRVRIERHGPGNQVRIEERIEEHEEGHGGEGRHEYGAEDGPRFERRFETLSEDGPIERREIRRGPGGNQDIIVRRFGGPEGPGERGEGDRADHLEQAIHHLHAAGLHDLAERVEVRAQNMRREPPANGEIQKQLDELRREHAKLKKQLQKLQHAQAPEKEEVGVKKN